MQVSFEVVLLGVLAVVAWKETEWGAILVAVAGETVSGLGFLFTYFNLTSEFGPQSRTEYVEGPAGLEPAISGFGGLHSPTAPWSILGHGPFIQKARGIF